MNRELYENDIINTWVDAEEPPETVNKRFEKLNKKALPLYKFVLAYSNYFNWRKDYGTGDQLTMMEAHILTDIVDAPGTTVTQLAQEWQKTTSAISQIVRRLIQWGFVTRINSKENGKYYYLHPTEKAKCFAIAHKRYDNIDIVKTSKRLLEQFTVDELVAFDNILAAYTQLLNDTIDKEKNP